MPTTTTRTDNAFRREVAEVLKQLRPAVQSDGGDIELVEVSDDGLVRVKLLGACIGCPSSSMTLKLCVEQTLKSHIPRVREVVCVN